MNIAKILKLVEKYKTPILYSGGSVAKAFAQMIVGFVVAKFVAPDDFGLWNTITLALTYSLFLQAGLINGLNRELPFVLGKDDVEGAKKMAGTVQTFTLIISLIVLLGGGGYVLFADIQNPKLLYGIIGMTIIIILNYYQNYLFSTFRSKSSFLNLSILQVTHAGVNLLTLVLVFYFSYYGWVLKSVIVSLVYVTFMHFLRPFKVKFLWDKASLNKLMSVGLPIFGLAYIESLASTIDRLLLLKYTDLKTLGIYSFGFYVFTSFSILPSSIASYIYPKMTYNFSKTGDRLIIWGYVRKITLLLFTILLPIAIVGYFLCPILIDYFFPAYKDSIHLMQIFLFAAVFSGSVIGVNALWSLKDWKHMIIYQVSFGGLLLLCPIIGFYISTDKVSGVALGVLAAHMINLISGLYITYRATHKKQPSIS
jgi:O-antigen/teichoic acid export membrane protein